jgi:hypothetical protein
MKNYGLIFSLLLMMNACAGTVQKTLQLSVGMTKAEVIQVMGQPSSSRATEGVEFLIYKLQPGTSLGVGAVCGMAGLLTIGLTYGDPRCRGGAEEDHFVKLQEGKVVSYGKVGDFDSTKDPTLNVNIKTK